MLSDVARFDEAAVDRILSMQAAIGAQRPFDPAQALRLARETFDIEAAALQALAEAAAAA